MQHGAPDRTNARRAMAEVESEFPKYLWPQVTPETAEFWAGTLGGELRIQRCTVCGLHQHYPRTVCSHCGHGSLDTGTLEWVTAGGEGTVHSYTVIRQHGIPPFRDAVPYVVALVDLDERGARILGRVPSLDPAEAAIGMRVRATFAPASDEAAFVEFEPASPPPLA
jgi:uncharacterized OB-fold protein